MSPHCLWIGYVSRLAFSNLAVALCAQLRQLAQSAMSTQQFKSARFYADKLVRLGSDSPELNPVRSHDACCAGVPVRWFGA